MKKELIALFAFLALATPATAAECEYNKAYVVQQQTADGSIAVPLNVVETASLVEGLRAAYPDGNWSRQVEDSIAFTLVSQNITRVVYFVKGCAKVMTDLPMDKFLEIISATAAKKTSA